ncbi:MAG: T9SS type A sorting domain-containing protein [Taibaiella sp.]|nr:T9SS type A sorting domain-containing protein [Taibaiella sp.]
MKRFFTDSFSGIAKIAVLSLVVLLSIVKANAQVTVTATGIGPGPTIYPTLGAAFAQINLGTHTGAITITVAAGGTNEGTTPAVLNRSGAGGSSYTSVLIKPATGTNPVIQGNINNNGVIFLFGASNVTIDGSNTVGGTTKNLTIQNTYTLAQTFCVIRMGNDATAGSSNNVIKNCKIRGNTNTVGYGIISSNGTVALFPFSAAVGGSAALFPCSNNTIENDSVYTLLDGFLSWGPGTAPLDDNWVVKGNDLSGIAFNGLQFNNANNSSMIDNYVHDFTINGGNAQSAILLSFLCTNVTIARNKIINITNTLGFGSRGMYFDLLTGSTNVTVFNNFISNPNCPVSATVANWPMGMYIDIANGLNIFHNTVHLNTTTGAPSSAAICFNPVTALGPIPANAINLQDNIFSNSQSAGARYAIYSTSPATIFSTINFNNYSSLGTLGFIGGAPQATLTAIQTSFGGNLNSVVLTPSPLFISATDLHLQTDPFNAPLVAGTPLAAVPTDIDNAVRSLTTPTIGAHELIDTVIINSPLAGTCHDDFDTLSNVQIKSPSGVPLAGVFVPRIYFRKGAGAWSSAAGTKTAGSATDGTWRFIISAAAMGGVVAGDIISYYVVAQNGGGTVFGSPNAGLAATDVNTIITAPTTPLTYTVNAVALNGLVLSNQVCFNPSIATNVPYSYASAAGAPNQYSLSWAPVGPTVVPAWTTLPASPINVNVPTALPAAVFNGGLTIRNSTTGCQKIYSIALTVNPLPATISGPDTTCVGSSVVFTSSTTGGTWSSMATGVATAGLTSGVITGVGGGNATIVYTLPTSCTTFKSIDVIAPPGPITGTASLCPGLTTTLSNATPGGGWSSGNPSVATVNPSTGVVTGVSSGNALIGYGIPGCSPVYRTVTVNPTPNAITGTLYACEGFSTTLSTTSTGGTWISGSPSVATIGSTTGVVYGVSGGSSIITYQFTTTGCITTNTVTIFPAPGPIVGGNVICQGLSVALTNSQPFGTWSSSMPGIISVGSTSGIATGIASSGTARITYTLPTGCKTDTIMHVNAPPTAISGAATVCEESSITLTNGTPGGTWTSGSVATAVVHSTAGIVTGINAGVVNISYSTLACNPAVYSVTVLPTPKPITGGITICNGAATTTVTDTTLGGVWTMTGIGSSISGTSTGPGLATAVVTGLSVGGTYIVTYTTPNGCRRTAPIIVDTLPAPIVGVDSVCPGRTVTFSTSSTGGVWSSANSSIASVVAVSGDVTGVAFGSTTITYASLSSCYRTKPIRVTNPIPLSVTLTRNPAGDPVCNGVPVTFTAHPVNGGATPRYIWQLFGVPVDTTDVDTNYTYIPTHGDVIRVFLFNSDDVCAAPTPAYVDMPVNVYPNISPTISISTPTQQPADGSHPYPYKIATYYGQPFTFNSLITSGGPGVAYQWYVDGDPVPGATNNTFVREAYDDDLVYCKVIGNPDCPTGTTATSGSIQIYADYLSASNVDGGNVRFSLFPNPNDGNFRLTGKLAAASNDEVKYEVVNVLGQVVMKGSAKAVNGNVDTKVVLGSNTASGTYMLRVVSGEGDQVFHFVVSE